MKKAVSVLLNLVLFVVLSSTVSCVVVLLVSYVDIIFTVSVESSWAIYGVATVAFFISVYLYFVFIKNKSGALTGSALAGASGAGAGLKSVFVYLVLIGVSVVFYGVAVLINSHVFGPMAEREKAALAQYGVTADWKSFYLDMEYKDPENAALYIQEAEKLFADTDRGEVKKFWDEVTGDKDFDRVKAMDGIKKLSEKTAKPIEAIEKALEHKKFMWDDIKAKKDYDIYSLKIPTFSTMRTFVHIKMLDAVRSAGSGDWAAAKRQVSKAVSMVNLLEEDPSLVGYLIRVACARAVYSGLVAVAKTGKDKKAALDLMRSVFADIRPFRDSYARAMRHEFSGTTAFADALSKGAVSGEPLAFGGDWVDTYATSAYYKVFGRWDVYVFMKGIGLTMQGISERDPAKRKANSEIVDKFYSEHASLPAIFASIGAPSYMPYFKRELMREADRDLVLLFSEALVYKAKHGKYPETLDKLVPDYMSAVPKNPLKNAPYVYKTSGEYMEIIAEPDGEDKPIIAIIGERPKQR